MIKNKYITKFLIILRQNLGALLIIIFWFAANYIFFLIDTSGNFLESFLILFYFMESPSLYGNFYSSMTEFIVFGILFSLITVELFRKYNPVEACRKFASTLNNHVIIIGFNHLGQRIAGHLKFLEEEYVVIDKNQEVVQDLIDNDEPVINDDALSLQTLLDAKIEKAKAVFVLSDHIELLMVVSSNTRKYNKRCRLICRVFEDDIGEVLQKSFNAETISTSKFTSSEILNQIEMEGYKNILLIGMNHINYRIMKKIKKYLLDTNYCLIEENEELIEDLIIEEDHQIIIGDPKEYITLKKIPIKKIDLVINTLNDPTESILITKRIRDMNKNCKLITRIFIDDIAEVLVEPPFNAQVISSSKFTLDVMKKKRYLNF